MASNPSTGFEFNRPTIISLLYLAGSITGISGIVGVVLAYIWRIEPHQDWEKTHYTYLIRTFWIGLIGFVAGFLLMIVLIGFLILLATAVWMVVRSILALINAQKRMAMSQPDTWLF